MTFTGCLLHSAGFIPGCQCSKRSTRHGPRTRHGAPALDGCARSRMLAIPPAWEQGALILEGTPRCGGRSRPPQEDTRCSVEESPHRRGAESGPSAGARQAAHTLRRHTSIRAWGGDPRGASCRARRPGWRPWSITPTAAWCSAGECQGSVPSTSTLPPSGRCKPAAHSIAVVLTAPLASSTAVSFPVGAFREWPAALSAATGCLHARSGLREAWSRCPAERSLRGCAPGCGRGCAGRRSFRTPRVRCGPP